MAKKKQVLKADTVIKNYWRDNARFADLFNAVLFKGRDVIQPGELVEARKNDLELHNMDNVDLFHLLGLFLDHGKPVDETKASAIEYAGEHNVNREVILTAAGVANRVVDGGLLGQEGVSAMCTFFDKLKEEGILEGRAEGRLEGRAEEIIDMGLEDGLSQAEILARLQKRLGVTKKEAEEYFEKFAGQMV